MDIGLLVFLLAATAVFWLPFIALGLIGLRVYGRREPRPVLKLGLSCLSVLFGVALMVPKVDYGYRKTMAKSREAELPEKLDALRAAIAAYRERTKTYPKALQDAVLGGLPAVDLSFGLGHAPSSAVETFEFRQGAGQVDPASLKDTGRWLYDAKTGRLLIDCTHHAAVASWAGGGGPVYTW